MVDKIRQGLESPSAKDRPNQNAPSDDKTKQANGLENHKFVSIDLNDGLKSGDSHKDIVRKSSGGFSNSSIYPKLVTEFKSGNQEGTSKGDKKAGDSASPGYIRHMIAILALSSIAMANMNRQAFNLSLTRMACEVSGSQEPIPIPEVIVDSDDIPTLDTAEAVVDIIAADRRNSGSSEPSTDSNQETQTKEPTTTIRPNIFQAEVTTLSSAPLEPEGHRGQTSNDSSSEVVEDKFKWTADQIATLQMAFYYGYAPFMIISGRLSEIYGAKWVVFTSGFGSALCCILAPFFADLNYYLLVATRVAMGLCQTGVSPALYALLARWLPPSEASVYLPMIKVGVPVGLMFGSLIGGFMTWRSTFYFAGISGILWSVMWCFVVSSDPNEHKWLSQRERKFIQDGIQSVTKREAKTDAERKQSAPWIRILTNPVVLALMLTKFTVKISVDAQAIQLPMFLKQVFKVSSELNGVLNATNQGIQVFFTGFVAYLANAMVIRSTFGLSKTGVRRLFQGICNLGVAMSYVLIALSQGSLTVVIVAVIVNSVFSMFGAGGEAVLPIDLSLEYSASIMAITNSVANLSGMVLPRIVVFLVGNQMVEFLYWSRVWFVVSAITAAGAFIFIFVVQAELQDFSSDKKESSERKKVLDAEVATSDKSRVVSVEMIQIKPIERD